MGYWGSAIAHEPAELHRELDLVREARRTFIEDILPMLEKRYTPKPT